VKLLRTIRLDPSDTFVFERAAEPGEWAVPGAFAFAGLDVARLDGKRRAAFRSGFLGIDSLGWSTLVQVVEASEEDCAAAADLLALRLVERFGAPSLDVAKAAAEEEMAFAASISNHPKGMLVALARKHDKGDIRETFRTLAPGIGARPARAFAIIDVAGEEDGESVEDIDLVALRRRGRS
jgi:uncharacterized protein DUF6505